jgi:acetyl-CoA carboxylase beta subunit
MQINSDDFVDIGGYYAQPKWFKDNINILQELVDKETPMKPIYENDLVDENIVVDTWAYCPNCKEEILYALWGNLNYCPNCGQHLDWSVDEDED